MHINALYFDVQLQMITYKTFDNPSLCKDLYLQNLISVVIEGKIKWIKNGHLKYFHFAFDKALFFSYQMTSKHIRLSYLQKKSKKKFLIKSSQDGTLRSLKL